jgi:hypothetical protein
MDCENGVPPISPLQVRRVTTAAIVPKTVLVALSFWSWALPVDPLQLMPYNVPTKTSSLNIVLSHYLESPAEYEKVSKYQTNSFHRRIISSSYKIKDGFPLCDPIRSWNPLKIIRCKYSSNITQVEYAKVLHI